MIEPQLTLDEPIRLQALRQTHQLDAPIDERFERITRLAQRLLGMPIAAISLIDADRQFFKSIQGHDAMEVSRESSFCAYTILQDDVMVVPDARCDARFENNPLVVGSPRIVFYAGCPLRSADGSKIGTLSLIDHAPRSISADEIQLIRDLAGIAESVLAAAAHDTANRDLLSDLDAISRQAQVDSLTRVWNRDSIFSLLENELARSRRAKVGSGIVIVDIDGFRQIVEAKGYEAGDDVLCQAAKRLLGAIREVDALGRFEDDEFMIVLGACNSLEGAEIVANRILKRVSESPVDSRAGRVSITASIGVAFADQADEVDVPLLVQTADAALARAKKAGTNSFEASHFTFGGQMRLMPKSGQSPIVGQAVSAA